MADYTKEEIFEIITEYLETYGSAIGSSAVRELTPEELTDDNLRVLTIPGMNPQTEEWVQTSMANMIKPITHAVSDLTTLKQQTAAARDAANTAATGASNVNAALVNMTVTITDRNGLSRSVDIGFEMYRTYKTVAAMNADAANVPQGKFVIIATDDPTAADNAKLYCKNSQGSFSFLSDLDQASSAAWAEWLNSMKPQIEAAIAQALSDHNRAVGDHQTAATDHQTATSDHSTALSDHQTSTQKSAYAKQQGDYAKGQGDVMKAWNEHQPYIGNGITGDANYWYIWVDGRYVKSVYAKGDDLDYSTMTEQERQRLIDNIKEDLIFASEQTCADIITELT